MVAYGKCKCGLTPVACVLPVIYRQSVNLPDNGNVMFSKCCGFVCMMELIFITYLKLTMLTLFLDHERVESNDFSGW